MQLIVGGELDDGILVVLNGNDIQAVFFTDIDLLDGFSFDKAADRYLLDLDIVVQENEIQEVSGQELLPDGWPYLAPDRPPPRRFSPEQRPDPDWWPWKSRGARPGKPRSGWSGYWYRYGCRYRR